MGMSLSSIGTKAKQIASKSRDPEIVQLASWSAIWPTGSVASKRLPTARRARPSGPAETDYDRGRPAGP